MVTRSGPGSTRRPRSVTIVGASLAGVHAARTLRTGGFEGPIVLVGAEPHVPYDRPPLSKQFLAGEWDSDRIGLPAVGDLDVTWRLGRRATALSLAERRLTLDGGEHLEVDALVVATGARPRHLGGDQPTRGVHRLRTLDDAVGLRTALDGSPSRVVVIGAGFVGAEVAATCRGRGLDVTLVDALGTPLELVLGAEVGGVLAALHRDHGVDLRLGVGVDRLIGDTQVEAVQLTDGAVVEAPVVVVAVGVTPEVDWLEGSGLDLDDGVVCDRTCLAGDGVVAAGDVARWPSTRWGRSLRVEHWEHAMAMGEAAARRLLVGDGRPEIFDPIPWFWSDQYDVKIQLAGVATPHDDLEVVGSVQDRRFVALYADRGRVSAVLGMNRPRHVVRLRPLVADRAPLEEAVQAARDIEG